MPPVKRYSQLEQPPEGTSLAVAYDESKPYGVWFFVYEKGKWSEESVQFAIKNKNEFC